MVDGSPPEIESVQAFVPAAAKFSPAADANGMWQVTDERGESLANIARTLPQAKEVLGYRGPSEALVVLDDKLHITGVDLIQSSDTDEHVEAVRNSQDFFGQFKGWVWGKPETYQRVDGVSGATLTSLALAGGVLERMGTERPSLVFPDPINSGELTKWFPTATRIEEDGYRIEVFDETQNLLGSMIRTGPLSESLIGYQGPTELLVQLELPATEGGRSIISDVLIRSSFDNEPYVGYCRTEYGFWARFKGQSLSEVAAMDLEAAGVEGVSGATMTSMAIAETLVASGNEYQARENAALETKQDERQWPILEARWTLPDAACVVLIVGVVVLRKFGGFRKRKYRLTWLLTVIVIIGLWSGNLVSMALIAGWGGQGIAWRLAPGLAAIAAVALVSPGVGKSNPYCNHLCPHGAIQQLIRPKPRSKRLMKLPRRGVVFMSWLPGMLLSLAYVALLFYPMIDLSSWEPFHAYLFRIAPWTAIALAVGTLVASAFIPMAYCRMGCPTGRLLDYLRRSASSDQWRWADGVAAGLLALALYAFSVG